MIDDSVHSEKGTVHREYLTEYERRNTNDEKDPAMTGDVREQLKALTKRAKVEVEAGDLESALRMIDKAGEHIVLDRIILSYRSNGFDNITVSGTRTIIFPYYPKSCHAVPLTEPESFYNDVYSWLSEDMGWNAGVER